MRLVMLTLDARGNGANFRLRLFEFYLGFEPPDEIGTVHESPRQLIFGRLIRQPEVSRPEGKLKARGQHTDHRIAGVIDRQRLTDNSHITAEFPLPKSISEHGHPFGPRYVFSGSKG